MNHIYIVKIGCGEYEDRSERSLCAVTTEEKAKTLVEQFIELNKLNCAFNQRVRNEFTNVWESNHLKPEYPARPKPPEGYRELQNALSNKSKYFELTDMKKLFKDLQDKHNANLKAYDVIVQEFSKQYRECLNEMELAKKEWIDKNYILPSHLNEVNEIADKANHHFYSYSDIKYTYYKLNVIH